MKKQQRKKKKKRRQHNHTHTQTQTQTQGHTQKGSSIITCVQIVRIRMFLLSWCRISACGFVMLGTTTGDGSKGDRNTPN